MVLASVIESMISTDLHTMPPALNADTKHSIENIFRPEVQQLLTPDIQMALRAAVAHGIALVFWITFCASLLCLILCVLLPKRTAPPSKKDKSPKTNLSSPLVEDSAPARPEGITGRGY
jgi:hypothetical protein